MAAEHSSSLHTYRGPLCGCTEGEGLVEQRDRAVSGSTPCDLPPFGPSLEAAAMVRAVSVFVPLVE